MAWAGWGAGPAGAGAAGGPGRWFLAIATLFAVACTGILAVRGSWMLAGVSAVCTAWFFARLFLGVGRAKGGDGERPGSP
jgi:hypothetical protein